MKHRLACTQEGKEVDELPPTLKEYLDTISREPTFSAIGQQSGDMVTMLKINNKKTQILFETGTTETYLIATSFVQATRIKQKR